MIYVTLTGQCGNQMFQYAAARALQLKCNNTEEICLCTAQLKKAGYTYVLPYFNIKNCKVNTTSISPVKEYGKLTAKLAMKISNFYVHNCKIFKRNINEKKIIANKYASRFGVFQSSYLNIILKPINSNMFLEGNFTNRELLKDILPLLNEEFKPKKPSPEKNKHLYEKMKSTNSVCITIRNWTGEHSKRLLCKESYFKNAVEEIKKRVDNPVFFLFSDNVEWAKSFLGSDIEIYAEDGTDDVAEKLKLMSSCKHFILTNSSFSWWAQELCTHDEKIVVSPKYWKHYDKKPSYFNDDNWVLIDNFNN